MVDTRTQNVVWSENYNRRMDNVLLLQAEITDNVFNELKLELSDAPEPDLVRGHTKNSEAYKEYLRGRFYWNKRKGPDIEKSIEFFQKAIELDPKYAKAWSGLADSYILMPEYSPNPSKGFIAKAKSAAMKALEINPDLAEAHATLAYSLATYERKFAEAERKYEQAIGLDPGYATAHQWYAELLSNLERHDEAIREIDTAQKLEPRSIIINIVKTTLLLNANRPDESIALSNKILSDVPGETICYIQLATAYRQKGNKDRFIENAIKLNRIIGKDKKFIRGLKTAFERGGFTGYYRFRVKSITDTTSPRWAAKFHMLAGDKEKAIEYLKDGFEQQQKSMLTIKADPDFDVLHDDSRFIELVKKLGFSK